MHLLPAKGACREDSSCLCTQEGTQPVSGVIRNLGACDTGLEPDLVLKPWVWNLEACDLVLKPWVWNLEACDLVLKPWVWNLEACDLVLKPWVWNLEACDLVLDLM